MMPLQPQTPQVQPLTPAAKAALEHLADVAMPAPPPWTPQTWGWLVLAVLLLALAAWLVVRTIRRRIVNRYRREALAELAVLEGLLDDDARRPAALRAIPALVKRVALGAWQRPEVAGLSGEQWTAFLRCHAGSGGLPDPAAGLLANDEYRPAALAATNAADARLIARQVRAWIEGHRVRA